MVRPSSLILFITIILFTACSDQYRSSELTGEIVEELTEQATPDGSYIGVLPCADCEGIETRITLSEDKEYRAERVYLGRSDSVYINSGQFTFSAEEQIIHLQDVNEGEAPDRFLVYPDRLIQLDMEGNRIESDYNTELILESTRNLPGAIYNRRWTLSELNNRDLTEQSFAREAPFLVFESPGGRVSGMGGCNRYQGAYSAEGERLEFDRIASTKMACPDLDLEQEFYQVLAETVSYSWDDQEDKLYFKDRSDLIVARFLSSD